MVNITIDNVKVTANEGMTIMEAAASAGVMIPHLCYLKDINEIGACRVCAVEIEGISRLVTACNNQVEEGMVIHTNTPKVRLVRRSNIELILSQHDCECAVCVRSGNCSLQRIANDLGLIRSPYKKELEYNNWNQSFPLIRDSQKCIKCMRCIQVCDKIQSLNIWDVSNTGSRTTVDVSQNRTIEEADCSLCGQCITHCPTGALRERDDVDRAFEALADPDKITVVQIAPAVRTAWGESLGLSREQATEKRLAAALKRIGFDYIFDTNFAADLTIMEEGSEFIEKLTHKGEHALPLFTSCCPGWVRFLKSQYPELTGHLSTAKSPQQMFGAMAKSYFADKMGIDPEKIFCVSIMPCLAKKQECEIPNINIKEGIQDVDLVLTTREIDRMIRAEHIIPIALKEEEFDAPFGIYSGAGVIFGAAGGVMEAALRSAHFLVTGKNPEPDAFKEVRGQDGIRARDFTINGTVVHTAVVNGLANARELITAMKRGEVSYDFVEVMACPGGCVGGGGQPILDGVELADIRSKTLYKIDKSCSTRFSHENPGIQEAYREYLEKPLSHKAHQLLHTDHYGWDMPLSPRGTGMQP